MVNKMEKQFSIVVSGSDEIKDIGISPGATVLEVMNEVGLQGYQLSRKGGELLSPDTDLFEVVKESEKLFATPQDVSVGEGGSTSPSTLHFIKNKFINFIRQRKSYEIDYKEHRSYVKTKKVRLIRTKYEISSSGSTKIRVIGERLNKVKVAHVIKTDREVPYWQQNGWEEGWNDTYTGYYQTNHGRYRGLIEKKYAGNYAYYIIRPPKALKKSEHWPCFSKKGKDKYSIHFDKKPKDINSGILTIEQLITESF